MHVKEETMITITELVKNLSTYLEAQRQLERCRQQATGNVDYYSYGYAQDLTKAEAIFQQTLNGYIDQRIAESMSQPQPRSGALVPAAI